MLTVPRLLSCLALAGLLTPGVASPRTAPATPIAHSHNDYLQERPLFDALDRGFTSIEADVFPRGRELRVAHTVWGIRKGRTLESLYLRPLRDQLGRARATGDASPAASDRSDATGDLGHHADEIPLAPGDDHHGAEKGRRGAGDDRNSSAAGGGAHDGATRAILLIVDVKGRPGRTYATLKELLAEYADIIAPPAELGAPGKVTILLSGRRPVEELLADGGALVGLDGRLGGEDDAIPSSISPLVSLNWRGHFWWSGRGEFPEGERVRLREMVNAIHAAGKKVRFWESPDREEVWRELIAAGVDVISADDLPRLESYLNLSPRASPPAP